MSNRFPAFMLYPTDLYADRRVAAMTHEEFGAYMFLLCMAWHEDIPGTLPDDDKTLASLAKLTPAKWKKCKTAVMAPWTLVEGRWHQKRMKAEYAKQVKRADEQARKGKSGADARWRKDEITDGPEMPVPSSGHDPSHPPSICKTGETHMLNPYLDDGPLTPNSESPSGKREREKGEAPAMGIPKHLPQSQEQAVQMAGAGGVPREFTEMIWCQYASTTFTDSQGRAITNWPLHVSARWKTQSHYDLQKLKQFAAGKQTYSTPSAPAKPSRPIAKPDLPSGFIWKQVMGEIAIDPKNTRNRMAALQLKVCGIPEAFETLKVKYPFLAEWCETETAKSLENQAREQIGLPPIT